ncbi:tail fiber assembly protein [Serratia silvae]|uniref:Tail fiber assembly protein n=1 Tax=Serratia silvae TaxID=2824122 RepID=A0ABT0KHW5_9GAMM|nr:tail fiber assembly protein [Serratia silvae]MCL1031372.1 tail fiber assembly protein [Serratia silvae]
MKLINLQRYTPDEYFNGEGIMYFRDATGKDWFKHLPEFTKKFSLAIDNDTGVIRSISKDASRLYPVGLTVVDVDNLPDGCDILGDWIFDGEKVILRAKKYEEILVQEQRYKDVCLEIATKAIAPIQDAKDLGVATKEELAKLKEWMIYRVQVNRIDVNAKIDVEWPATPE